MDRNRAFNMSNPAQGKYKKVFCVCSAGLLRSPTAALVLSQEPFNFNTRAAGMEKDYALVVVDEYLLHWCDEVVCMSRSQELEIKDQFSFDKPVICLNIDDSYDYRDPKLIKLIAKRYQELSREKEKAK